MRYRHFLLAVAVVVAGCGGRDDGPTAPTRLVDVAAALAAPHTGLHGDSHAHLPVQELAQARLATGRYHDVGAAILDGYHDTGIVLPNMGRHFLNESLLDGTFESGRPELLVYSPDSTRLLAVEYAVPIDLSAEAPEGFTGGADEWVQFGGVLWTLHAWVWKENPDGIFRATNRLVE